MTALSGGDQPNSEGRSPTGSVLERPGVAPDGARPAARPLGQIFPSSADSKRDELMRQTCSAFDADMGEAVRTVTAQNRSLTEIAYAVGEIVHNHFRAHGVTLTSYELRHLVGELLDRNGVGRPEVLQAAVEKKVETGAEKRAEPESVVSFEKEPPAAPWQGEEPPAPLPDVAEQTFEPPQSKLVEMLEREEASFDRLLAEVVDGARPRTSARSERAVAKAIIAATVDKVLADEGGTASVEVRRRLETAALSELCGLGLIDRLWNDHTVHAVYVNGPAAIFVERNGVVERVEEAFRDPAHLTGLMERLVPRPASGVAELRLRDGTSGVVVFPPAAPRGPVLVLKRAEPGAATFDRLVAADVLSGAMADLLRVAVRCRLNILASGPAGSGKTALLAALARELEEARLVTVARHRAFRSAVPSRIELVAEGGPTRLPALIAAAIGLRPDFLIVDSVQLEDVPALVERLSRGARGTAIAVEPASVAAGLAHSVDLVVRLARCPDGLCRVLSIHDAAGAPVFAYADGQFVRQEANPAFGATVRSAGHGEALAAALR